MAPLPKRRTTSEEPVLARSAMHKGYGGIARRFFEWLFGPMHYPAEAAQTVHDLDRRGVVVYVIRARSSLLSLYFNHALTRLGLPLPSFIGGLSMLLWQPVERLWRLWRQRGRRPEGPWLAGYVEAPPTRSEALLADMVYRGEPAFLFMQGTRGKSGGFKTGPNDYVRALVAAQRVSESPIFVLPHVLADKVQSGSARRTLRDRLLGDVRRPGRVRTLFMLLSTLRHATVRLAEPIDLAALVDAHAEDDDAQIARRVSHELEKRIREEERVVAGPELLARETVARHVLRDPVLRGAIEVENKNTGRSIASIERKATKYLREIAADYDVGTLRILDRILDWILNRIYDGIVVDEAGLSRVIEASREGPVIFCPTHRSHIDYLVLSSVLWHHGVAPPHIAAGANLSFWPLGPLFRACGAFFLRRSFRDNRIYGAVFRAYMYELLENGTSLEFFLEGTRSRTGKLLMPRFGMLGMVVEAWRRGAREDVLFAPVSIDYERIIEAGIYERELLGGEKKSEDIGQLLKATQVLRSKYGRVLLQFGQPLSLKALAEGAGLSQSVDAADEPRWRREVERLGYRILHEMAMVCSVTPTAVVATVLLGYEGRGIAHSGLLERSERLIEYLDAGTARLSDALVVKAGREAACAEAVQRLVDDGLVSAQRAGTKDSEPIYTPLEDKRIRLDYYKNGLMNYFAPASIVARIIRRYEEADRTYQNLYNASGFLSRLFKREFVYRVDATFDSHFDDTMAALAFRGSIDVHEDGRVTVRDPETIAALAGLLDSFVEGYFSCALALKDLRDFPLWDKELETRAMERARRAYLEGRIKRPEAASRTLVATALKWFEAAGVLETHAAEKRRTLQLSADYAGSGLDDLIDDIAAYL